MSTIDRHRVYRWSDRFPPRGAWHALAGIVGCMLLVNRDALGAFVAVMAFGLAEIAYEAFHRP